MAQSRARGIDCDEVNVREDVDGREEPIDLTGPLAVPARALLGPAPAR